MSSNGNELYQYEDDMLQQKYLIFNLDKDLYGMKIEYVTEIIGMQHITVFPEVPIYVKGVINLRGRIIPVVDLRLKLKNESAEYGERTCIIITEIDNISVGLIVDGVEEVETILPQNISLPPNYKNMMQSRYVEGVVQSDDKVKILLDSSKILKDDELEELKDVNQNT